MARATNPEPSNSERTLSKTPAIREIQIVIRECIRCTSGKKCGHLDTLKKLQKEEKTTFASTELQKTKAKKTLRKKL
jgi:hypothetical protein